MPSPSDFSRRASNQASVETSTATPLPMTTSGLSKMIAAIKETSREIIGGPMATIATASNALTGAAMGAGFSTEGAARAIASLAPGLPAALNGAVFGVATTVASVAAISLAVGSIVGLARIMRDNQDSMKAAVSEARENAQQRLQQDDGAAYNPRPT